ncbi:hypothetical protein [uncultured Rikenella sp.]|uniref:hypothetical protein n=1 Tax=uncultured Rikenella sp. TaxID=368003 RepID=UPI002614B561|nr:hypothetical protein [uncultured Rikenella sp.]
MRAGPSAHPRSAQTEHDNPAPGYRTNIGVLSGLGDHGASWSSSTRETSALYIALRPYYLNPNHLDRRGYGFQLRCLSE